MRNWNWALRRLTRRLWLRTSLIGLLGILTAILAALVERYIPWDLPHYIGVDAVGGLLNIIASSMLAVTTFSLSVMTNAYASATSNITPRATRLLIEDPITQNALSTFVGSFLFAIVGLIVLPTGAYGERGRAVLFFFTIAIIGLIVISLLRWIDHLTGLGRVGETAKKIEATTQEALDNRIAQPWLGCRPYHESGPAVGTPITAEAVGYLQYIDAARLQSRAEKHDRELTLDVLPGAFIYRGTVLGWLDREPEADTAWRAEFLEAFTIGDERSFEQDPRYGFIVLSEVAQRALSPGINDPGTAIDIIIRVTRLLTRWAEAEKHLKARYDRVHAPGLRDRDLLEDAFMLIGRDGAGMIEVQLRLQKSLAALRDLGDPLFREAVREQQELARLRALAALPLEADHEMLRRQI